ncbi:MAG: hypothetical protein JO233_02630 [Candidatus Eremiobacteraeota bacterium]|nr:hypothetical protein [Candidatus Eremiobacteraeota bacterium]
MREPGTDSRWLIVGRTLKGATIKLGPYEKRYAEQMLADIRNRVASGNASRLESSELSYTDIDLTSLGMEQDLPN